MVDPTYSVDMTATVPADGIIRMEVIIIDPNQTFGTPFLSDNNCLKVTNLNVVKTSQIYSGSASHLAIPGSDALYQISVSNTGDAPVDSGGLFLYDALPPEVTFYNGDIDDAGPETNPVKFTQSGASLTFNYASDVAYSNGMSPPSSMADCTYTPSAGYDANVRYVCVEPGGSLLAGNPDPSFSIQFRTGIK